MIAVLHRHAPAWITLSLLFLAALTAFAQPPAGVLLPAAPDVLLFGKPEMVPLQPMAEVLGAKVTMTYANMRCEVSRGNKVVVFTIAAKACVLNGEAATLEIAPAFRGRTIYVPFQPLITGLGGEVTDDIAGQKVTAVLHNPDLTITCRLLPQKDPFDKYHPPAPDYYIMDADGGNLHRLTSLTDKRWALGFSPDGQAFISYNTERIYLWKYSAPTRMSWIKLPEGSVYAPMAISPDSQWLLYAEGPSAQERDLAKWRVGRIRLDGTGQQNLAMGRYAAFSPDGKSIVFESWDAKAKKTVVCVFEIEANKGKVLGEGNSPRFSRDGQWIAFLLGDSGVKGTKVGVMDAKGGNRQLLGEGDYPAFSPDSARLLFYRAANPNWQNVVCLLAEDKPGTLYEPTVNERKWHESYAGFSADGKSLLLSVTGKGLLIMDADRANPRVITPRPVWSPAFSADGNRIFCISGNQLCSMPAAGGELLALTPYDIEVISFTLSPDGKRIVFTAYPERRDLF